MGKQLKEMLQQKKEQQSVKQERLLRLKQVLQIIPVSKSTWWAGCASGRFPAGTKLTERTTVWKSSEIDLIVSSLGGV